MPQRASWSLPPCEDRVRRPRHLQPSRGPPAAGDLGLPASRLRGSNACCFYVFICLFAYFYLFIFVATLVKRLSLVSSGLRSFVTVFASLRQSARGISGPPGRTGGRSGHLLLRQAQRHHVQPQAASRRTETRTHSHPLGSPGGSKSTAISWLYKESQVIHRFLVYKWGKIIENSRGPSRRLHGSPQPPSALTACPPPPGAQCLRRPEVVLSPQVRNSAHLQCLPAPGPSQPASRCPCTQDRKSGSFKASGGWTQSLPHRSEPLDLGTESIWMRDR